MDFRLAAWIVTGKDPFDGMDEKEYWEHRERMKEKWGSEDEEETEEDPQERLF